MGLLDNFRKKPEEAKPEEKTEQASESSGEAKFNQVCSLCGKGPTDVKWMGQYWHVRCKRAGKKMAKRMM